jgi:hypothetical protein
LKQSALFFGGPEYWPIGREGGKKGEKVTFNESGLEMVCRFEANVEMDLRKQSCKKG